jgi:hypothetical protein
LFIDVEGGTADGFFTSIGAKICLKPVAFSSNYKSKFCLNCLGGIYLILNKNYIFLHHLQPIRRGILKGRV